jgi:D-tyrosyl-tRNA(Tyr) deacylase
VASATITVISESTSRKVAEIGAGLLALVGVERNDGPSDSQYIASKIRNLRIFEGPADPARHLNLSVVDIGGSVLIVSQFTLSGDCRRGRRPSFDAAAPPEMARPLYEDVIGQLRAGGLRVETGEFQAKMHVTLVNDGPVTVLLDSRRIF